MTGPPIPNVPWLPLRSGGPGGSAGGAGGGSNPVPTPVPSPPTPSVPARTNLPLFARDVTSDPRLRRFTEKLAQVLNSLIGEGFLYQTGPYSWSLRSGVFEEARPPAVTDDGSAGVVAGSVWIDTAAGTVYICASNANGAANWRGPI